jgi:hypothetical protein
MAQRFLAALRGTRPPVALMSAGTTVVIVLALAVVDQAVIVGATACLAAPARGERFGIFLCRQANGGI